MVNRESTGGEVRFRRTGTGTGSSSTSGILLRFGSSTSCTSDFDLQVFVSLAFRFGTAVVERF